MANALDERSRSLWMEVIGARTVPLSRDVTSDVVVVGAGISGLSAAYELVQHGFSVVVLDKGDIVGGMSLRTSAHLSWEMDDYYFELIERRGEAAARAYCESQRTAVERIETIARLENIDCDFVRVDGFVVASGDDGREIIANELEAVRRIGFRGVEQVDAPKGFGDRALRFPNQARFHPGKYLHGLADALTRKGVELHGSSHVEAIGEDDGKVTARVANGASVTSRVGVVATNSPINDKLAIHTKQAPYRTYVLAARVPKGSVPDVLIWDTEDPYHYVRIQPGRDEDIVLVGGEDHRSGLEDDGDARIERLREWARARMPRLGESTHAWSGQVYEPIDYVPHMGRNPGDENVYVITGDSGEGLTSGVAGALLIADLVTKGSSPFEELYDPERKKLSAAGTFVKENIDVVANFMEHLTAGEIDDVDALKPESGALVRANGKKLAVYRDDRGELHVCSATCPHMGCVVQFNSFERCWDCPCHGSQFSVDGVVLAAPARAPLERAEL